MSATVGHTSPQHAPHGAHVMESHETGHHIVPVSTYIKVITSLMVLLIITLAAAAVDFAKMSPNLAWLNITIAMAIAIVKAIIIIMYFMHVKYSSKLVCVFAFAAFYWVMILFGMTYVDYFARPESLSYPLPG